MEKETALKILRELHAQALFSERTALETLIPELKESDDERIRKFIIHELVCLRAGEFVGEETSDRYKELNNAIYWLEKQGEWKPAWNEEDEEQLDRAIYMMKQLDMTKSWDDVYNWLKSLKNRVQPQHKQGEQKETLCDKCRKTQPSHSCQDITELGRCALEKQGGQKVDNSVKTFKDEQNTTEWILSYGKNETAGKLIALAECLEMDGDCEFNGLSGNDYGKLLRVLAKKLIEVKPTWSEEDEKSNYNPYKVTVESISAMVEKYAPLDANLQDFYDNVKIKCKDAVEYDKIWLES